MSFGLSNLISFFLVTFKVSYDTCFIVSVLLTLVAGVLMHFVQDSYNFTPLPNKSGLQVELHEEEGLPSGHHLNNSLG